MHAHTHHTCTRNARAHTHADWRGSPPLGGNEAAARHSLCRRAHACSGVVPRRAAFPRIVQLVATEHNPFQRSTPSGSATPRSPPERMRSVCWRTATPRREPHAVMRCAALPLQSHVRLPQWYSEHCVVLVGTNERRKGLWVPAPARSERRRFGAARLCRFARGSADVRCAHSTTRTTFRPPPRSSDSSAWPARCACKPRGESEPLFSQWRRLPSRCVPPAPPAGLAFQPRGSVR